MRGADRELIGTGEAGDRSRGVIRAGRGGDRGESDEEFVGSVDLRQCLMPLGSRTPAGHFVVLGLGSLLPGGILRSVGTGPDDLLFGRDGPDGISSCAERPRATAASADRWPTISEFTVHQPRESVHNKAGVLPADTRRVRQAATHPTPASNHRYR